MYGSSAQNDWTPVTTSAYFDPVPGTSTGIYQPNVYYYPPVMSFDYPPHQVRKKNEKKHNFF
ncbi:hypothetical protein TcasGA2_TC031651 [Tribolium castaneum]|uniref:Uncharacterized protein n=1 Tax=Tribolium castaneum TaxID=7070 RepID=A0A139W9W4_TRICA|nr:hypothetical protein TcasGA2_TC031651 [Tribolium castaneum]